MRIRDIIKEQLVKDKAIEIIVQYGLEGFTMNKLAKACSISVGTPYIYYKDKDDLILKIVLEEGSKMEKTINKDFYPELTFEDGLRIQWRNRFHYMLENPMLSKFFDQIGSSSYHQQFLELYTSNSNGFLTEFRDNMARFIFNCIDRGETQDLSIEVFWAIAFAPLYTLMKFHQQGKSVTGAPFMISEDLIWNSFGCVIKALKK